MKNEARLRARKAVDIIRRESLTIMATWNGNLYKRCLEGVAEFERLRPRVKPATAPARYCSLMGQQAAGRFAAASLDSVLTVLIGETADDKWQYDIVTDVPGVCFGSPVGRPLASREEAEKGALGGLALLGAPLQPADDYEPENLEGRKPIRVNGAMYGVAELRHEQLSTPLLEMCRERGLTLDELQITFARMLLDDAAGHPVRCRVLTSLAPDEAKNVALGVLAHSGWSHVSDEVVEGFAYANGVDLVDRVQGEPRWDAEGGSPMRDDLFQFLADQEEGGRPGSVALAPSRPNAAPKCGRYLTRSKLASVPSASSRNRAMSHYDAGIGCRSVNGILACCVNTTGGDRHEDSRGIATHRAAFARNYSINNSR